MGAAHARKRPFYSDAEQQLLERMIDAAKPPEATAGTLHYLLFAPLRYRPLRHGSRFGRRADRGIWYGAETLRTLFAEAAYYRLVSLEGTSADLGTLEIDRTVFRAQVVDGARIDLTTPPFDGQRPRAFEDWRCTANRAVMEVASRSHLERQVHTYPRKDFTVDGRLPAPAA